MQIEQLASMPTELPPRTTTTIADAAAASPRIWSFQTLVMAKWRSRGALILYAAVVVMLLGCKMFWPAPRPAGASASGAKTATSATKQPAAAKSQLTNKTKAAVASKTIATAAHDPGDANGGKPPASALSAAAAAAPLATAKKPATAPTTARVRTAKRAPATAPADPLGPMYIDEANGFAIRFPAGWALRTFDGDPWVIDAGDGRVGLISVGFAPFPEGFTTESIPPDWIAKKIKRRADTTLHGQGYSMIGGRKALWSKSTGPLPMTHASPRMTRVNYILPLGDGRVLELRVAASPEQFERLVPVMKKSVETFALQTPQRRQREPMASAR